MFKFYLQIIQVGEFAHDYFKPHPLTPSPKGEGEHFCANTNPPMNRGAMNISARRADVLKKIVSDMRGFFFVGH